MPRSIEFKVHPAGHATELHGYYLFENMLYPNDILHEKLTKEGKSIFDYPCDERPKIAKQRYGANPMPLAYWMYKNTSIIEEKVHEQFWWTFERYYRGYEGDEYSETAFGISPPYWIATAHDFERSCVHRNFTIAVCESFGDMHIMRGEFSYKTMFKESHFTDRTKHVRRLVDAIKEFQRIRNFRLARTGVALPE